MLDIFLPKIKARFLTVPGINSAYSFDDIPGKLSSLPAAVILPISGSQSIGGAAISLHRVQVVVYQQSMILSEAYKILVPMVKNVRDALLLDISLGGAVSYCQPVAPPEPWYEIGNVASSMYADASYIGIIFKLQIKSLPESLVIQ